MKGPVCTDHETVITKRIKLKRRAIGLTFFDGSFSPLRRIWPVIEYSGPDV